MAFSVKLQHQAFVFVCECVSVCIGVDRKGNMALLALKFSHTEGYFLLRAFGQWF